MKVKIGPYLRYIGPYQIARIILFWIPEYKRNGDCNPSYKIVSKFGKWLSNTWVDEFTNWVHAKRKRTQKVKIHSYDCFNIDHTLALVILPLLYELRNQSNGYPMVDIQDLPPELRVVNYRDYSPQWCFSFYEETREEYLNLEFSQWNWILNEMIFAFEHIIDDSWEEQFREKTNTPYKPFQDLNFEIDFKTDFEEMRTVEERIQNGLNLFGKYYRALWT